MIVDAHHHLWDPARRAYPWMTGPYEQLAVRRDVADLRAVAEPLGVEATIAVQAAISDTETQELLATDGPVAGVVGWVDLSDPDIAARLLDLRADGFLVGIRHPVHDEPDPVGWLARADVRFGLQAVANAGLVYDLLIFPEHLPAAIDLAAALPDLSLVVDHGAKPRIADNLWEPWSSELAALAGYPNVCVKLSGLVTEARWGDGDSVIPYARRLLELFGPDRTMFGSDWPVCTVAATYEQVVELAMAAVDPSDREAVFGDTATRVYGL